MATLKPIWKEFWAKSFFCLWGICCVCFGKFLRGFSYYKGELKDVQDFEEVKLGDDEYYVMGDNRPYSKDSRYVGPVKKSQLFAKKMLVLLPISDIGVKD